MDNPLVSIIIACYNGEKYIDMCLTSLVTQTYSNLEIIICDDASTDNSLCKLKEWAIKDNRIIVLHNESNLFAAATRNNCIAVAKGEYIAIQDIDDISDVNRIQVLIESINNTNFNFVSSSAGVFKDTPNKLVEIFSFKNEYPSKRSFLWGIPFFHPATMFTKECLMEVGGYRVAKETRRGQDYDLFMRLYSKGYRGRQLKNVLYYYRLDEGNFKRRDFNSTIGEIIIRWKGFGRLGLYPLALPFVVKPLLAHIIQIIKYYGKR